MRTGLTSYYEALLGEQWADVCERLSAPNQKAVLDRARRYSADAQSCEAGVPVLRDEVDFGVRTKSSERWERALREIPRARVRVKGDLATVRGVGDDTSRLIHVDGEWKVAGEDEAPSWP